jgi:hypothetical protein
MWIKDKLSNSFRYLKELVYKPRLYKIYYSLIHDIILILKHKRSSKSQDEAKRFTRFTYKLKKILRFIFQGKKSSLILSDSYKF